MKIRLADASNRSKKSNNSHIELISLTNPSVLNGLAVGLGFEKIYTLFKSIGGIQGIIKSFSTIKNLYLSLKELKPTINSLVAPVINPKADLNIVTEDDEIPDEGYLIFPRGRPKKRKQKRRVSASKKRMRMREKNMRSKNN